MRIKGPKKARGRAIQPAAVRPTGGGSATGFLSTLQKRQADDHEARLEQLYDKLVTSSQEISLNASLLTWESFRTSARDYLNEVRGAFKLRREVLLDREGNQRLVVLVDVADRELAELGEAFMKKEGDNLAFLAKVKRLLGLLLDMKS